MNQAMVRAAIGVVIALAVVLPANTALAAPSDSQVNDMIMYTLVGLAYGMSVTAGVVSDIDLLRGDYGARMPFYYSFSIANVGLGAGLLGAGIRRRSIAYIILGAVPLLLGVIGLITTPIRDGQRLDERPGEDPARTAIPLNSGFGWSF